MMRTLQMTRWREYEIVGHLILLHEDTVPDFASDIAKDAAIDAALASEPHKKTK